MKGLFSGWAAADGWEERSSGGARGEPGITRSLLALNPGQVSNTINYWEIYGPSHFHHLLSPLQLQPTWTVNYHFPRPMFAAVWTRQWDPLLSWSKTEGIPSLYVPNPQSHCNPELWGMKLHASVDTLAPKHWFKHTQMLVYSILYIIPQSYASLGTSRKFSTYTHAGRP